MKLRIQGNTIRLRLKKSDIDLFTLKGIVSEKTNFSSNTIFNYSLKSSSEKEISATFNKNNIIVSIPKKIAENWVSSDLISLKNKNSTPEILIEKDFKCTSKVCEETEEQKNDSYPNPNEKC